MFRTPRVGGSTKVLLLLLADHMPESTRVSVPRTKLAEQLGCHPSRITEHLQMAVDAGLLGRVRAGAPGVTAEYVAMLPGQATARVRPASSKPLARLTDGADDRTTDMVRFPDQAMMRTTAPSGHAQHGADDQFAKGKNTGTAAGRAACEPSTSEPRNDRGSAEEQSSGHRALDRGAA